MIVFPAYDAALAPLAGLAPSWDVLVDAVSGTPVASPPTISEIGGGLYRIENGIFSGSAGIVDLGATATPRYLHLDADTKYTLAAYDATLAPLAGLAPTWSSFVDAATGLAIIPTPAITELSGGLYRIDYADTTPAAGVIDLGATATPRYFAFTMDVATSGGPPVLSTLSSEEGGIGYEIRSTKARI